MTRAESDALKWLADHGGDGVFADRSRQVLHAQGEKAPFMRSTWNALAEAGFVEFYGNRRCRLVCTARMRDARETGKVID